MFVRTIDDFLRGSGAFAVDASLAGRLKWLLLLVVLFGISYGIVMGCFSGLAPGRWHQLIYSGVKVPILLLVTFVLCLPSFFVVNTISGLRDDFGAVMRALVSTQACVTIVLASLAPLTALFYVSCSNYAAAVGFNGLMFFVASITAQLVVRRYYAPLIKRSPRHRSMLYAWFFLYIFVGIQMGWVLRPFVGDPKIPVAFFRQEAWGNAYVHVGRLIGNILQMLYNA